MKYKIHANKTVKNGFKKHGTMKYILAENGMLQFYKNYFYMEYIPLK